MELKKVLDELEIVNEVNNLSLEELRLKYYQDRETYDKFLRDYSNIFMNRSLYQIRVGDHYNKIITLFDKGNELYSANAKENNEILDTMLVVMARNKRDYDLENIDRTGKHQATFVFMDKIGAYKISRHPRVYERTLLELEETARKFDSMETTSKDFLTYVYKNIKDNTKTKEEVKEVVDKYIGEHDIMSLCNNTSFLLFANFMFRYNRDVVDDNFIKEVESIIKSSQLLQKVGCTEEFFDAKDYNKLANYTLKNIKYDEKAKNKKEKNGLRKVKQIFTRNSNK